MSREVERHEEHPMELTRSFLPKWNWPELAEYALVPGAEMCEAFETLKNEMSLALT